MSQWAYIGLDTLISDTIDVQSLGMFSYVLNCLNVCGYQKTAADRERDASYATTARCTPWLTW